MGFIPWPPPRSKEEIEELSKTMTIREIIEMDRPRTGQEPLTILICFVLALAISYIIIN